MIEITCTGAEMVRLNDLEDFQGNLKSLTQHKVDKLLTAMKQDGFSYPFFYWQDKDGTKFVFDGHQRQRVLEYAKSKGVQMPDEFPACKVEAKDKHDAARKLLAFNERYGTIEDEGLYEFMHEYDLEMEEISNMELDDINMDAFEVGYFGEPETDEVPDVEEEPVSKRGAVYQVGKHRVMCGDSTGADDVGLLMNGGKAEVLFTSPPYSDMRDYGGNDLSIGTLIKFIPTFYPYTEYQVVNLGIQRKDYNINCYWDDYIKIAEETGFKFLAWNVWAKPSAGGVGNQSAFFPICHEWIFVFGKQFKDINRTKKRRNKPTKGTRGVRQKDGSMKYSGKGLPKKYKEMESVFFSNPELGAIRGSHPATFPVELPVEYINAMTSKGDIVVDCFLGSGSTLIACEKTNRTCYGMEIDPHYVDVIRKRWAEHVHGEGCDWQGLTPGIGDGN